MTTTLTHRPRRRDRYAWYPKAEAAWAAIVIPTLLLIPYEALTTPILLALVVPAAFFLLIRIVAAIATLEGRDGAR